jgi:phenylacetate-CoA ligase
MYTAVGRRLLWSAWERLHGRKTPGYLSELERTQWLSLPEVQARQSERRRRIVEYARREVPFFRRRFDALGIDPAHCLEPEVWQRIPLLTKADLQKHGDELTSDRFRGKPLIVSHSGGSTGAPVEFRFDRDYYDHRIAGWYRADRWAGWDLGERHIMLWLGVGAGVGERRRRQIWKERLQWRFLNWKTLTVTRMGRDRMRLYYDQIMKFRPRTIFCYASPLYAFAQFLQEEKLPPPKLRGLIVSGEKAFRYQKEFIRQVFQAPVFDRYGCQEFSNIAMECERHDGLHVNADGLYVEITDDRGVPVKPGEVGQIVVTSFDALAMPFIRYKMGDLGSLIEKACPCGRGLPRIGEVLGREMDMIHTPEGNVCAGIMMPHFMKEFAHIRGFQFVQEELGRLRLRIIPEKGFDKGILGFMEEQLRRYVGPTMKIEFEFVEELETLMSGKYKMVVSRLGKQERVA